MNAVEILEAAKARIATPDKWYQGNYGNSDRSRLCAFGACDRVSWSAGHKERNIAFDALDAVVPNVVGGFIAYNDDPTTTHDDILALFDRAIEKAKENEKK